MSPPFLERIAGRSYAEFLQLGREERAAALRGAIPDLHFFFDEGRAPGERDAPRRTLELARSLWTALVEDGEPRAAAASLRERIITDALLREEADRDQNVYLGRLLTRRLTRAVPDLIFQPATTTEAARALAWAREQAVPVTLRGAASTALGGSVPADGGLTLDLSRLDTVAVEAGRVCAVGAGARLRRIHQELAERGLALKSYPSNLGGTLVGWFVTGGIGLNAFGRGRALDAVRAADVLLPSGEHVRFHDDGRLDVPAAGHHHQELRGEAAREWLAARGCGALGLSALAGSEGAFGLVLQVAVEVEPRPEIGAFLLGFPAMASALAAAERIAADAAAGRLPAPANLKLLSASHLHHTRRVWRDEDAREWRQRPSTLSTDAQLPWRRILGPRELGLSPGDERDSSAACLFVDFLDLDAARTFAGAVAGLPGPPAVLAEESVRFAAERFRPQQTKRLGPGLLAAEILMPAAELAGFLPRAEAMARNAGTELDAEVYYLADGEALAIAAFLVDHRRGDVAVDLTLAPALLDLAVARHHGRPYVVGRWLAGWLPRKFGAEGARRLRAMKDGLDPAHLVNRGVLFGPRLAGLAGALLARAMVPGTSVLRRVYQARALRMAVRAVRGLLRAVPGPARGRGEPLAAATPQPTSRALHCVNCGECNSVCPVFHDAKVRLPQTLTHLVEALHGGRPVPPSGSVLLDLCMRCGNCEEVCQAGIPHLSAYAALQEASDRRRPRDVERHTALLTVLRSSPGYLRDFLQVRPGGYVKRTPASLPGVPRFVLLRAENEDGPAATCIHCGGCVPVCPTHANREFEGTDPRAITTLQDKCIGCGTCVEVCPANHANGGQTLRVMEAPTTEWFDAVAEFEEVRP